MVFLSLQTDAPLGLDQLLLGRRDALRQPRPLILQPLPLRRPFLRALQVGPRLRQRLPAVGGRCPKGRQLIRRDRPLRDLCAQFALPLHAEHHQPARLVLHQLRRVGLLHPLRAALRRVDQSFLRERLPALHAGQRRAIHLGDVLTKDLDVVARPCELMLMLMPLDHDIRDLIADPLTLCMPCGVGIARRRA